MSKPQDQALLEFALGDLPTYQRLMMRIRLLLDRGARPRLAEISTSATAIAEALAPGGAVGFRGNLAIKLRRLAVIDLCIAIGLVVTFAAAGVYSWTYFSPSPVQCAPGESSQGSVKKTVMKLTSPLKQANCKVQAVNSASPKPI